MEMNSSAFVDLVEPGLTTAFDGVYKKKEPQWPQIFEKQSGQKARFQESTMLYGFGLAVETGEGAPVSADQGGIAWRVRMIYRKYALSFGLTEELMEDSDGLNIAATMSRHLGTSMYETEELIHADVFNRCEDTTRLGGDGVTLLNTAHPLAQGGTWSNRLTAPADFSEAALEALLTKIRTATDDRGNKIAMKAVDLIVPPEVWFDAIRVLRATLQTGTNSNDPNAIASTGALPKTPIELTRLTLPTAFFIKTDCENGLKHYSRYDMRKKMEGDFSTSTMRYKAAMRFVCGWENPRCLYGSQGL